MSVSSPWTMYTISRYFADRHRELIDQRVRRYRKEARDRRVQVGDRLDQLEDDLGRAVLLIQSLAEACLQKGVFTREELARLAEQIDLADGVADGKLDPAVLRPPEQEASQEGLSPEDYLKRLEDGA